MAEAPAWFEDGGKEPLPAWFDAELHHAGTGGIVETATGTLLDLDGLPVSGPLRAERLAAAADAATGPRGRRYAPADAVVPAAAATPQE